MGTNKPWAEGSFLWFMFSLVVPPALTIVGLVSTWLLFGADELNLLKRPEFEYQIALSANPVYGNAPEVITETITIANTGLATTKNVTLRIELGVRIADGATAKFPSKQVDLYTLSESAVRVEFTKLQAGEFVEIAIPLERQEILRLPQRTVSDFLKSQSIHVTCDEGKPDVSLAGEPIVPLSAIYHLVQPGETLPSIGRLYGVNPYAIAQANGLLDPNRIYSGQVLLIPQFGDE